MSIDWTASMQQTFEYYVVDPATWKDKEKLDTVISCTITYDSEAESLGSASFEVTDTLGECYIRPYLVAIQNGETYRFPLGCYLVQTPSSTYDGKVRKVTMDAYTPLIELKEKQPPLGYSVLKGETIMDLAYELTRENVRAPVVEPKSDEVIGYDFVANTDDTWLSFLTDFMSSAKYEYALDEVGRVLFSPKKETRTLQPVWTFTDDNSSILEADISMDHDLYGIPNVVEVIYTSTYNHFYAKVTNDDPNSPTSTVNRGREITQRSSDPSFSGEPTQEQIELYAEKLLEEASTVEYSITYTHGYCPVRIGDCVRINYTRAGLTDIKAKVISQDVKCSTGCTVSEKAVYTTKLWESDK